MDNRSTLESRISALEETMAANKIKLEAENNTADSIFDTETPLAGLYIAILFNYLGNLMNCDFQKWMNSSLFFRHVIGIISFFFLFTSLIKQKGTPLHLVAIKTVIVYFTFLLMTKSKWYFALPLLLLLIIDQYLKNKEVENKTEQASIDNHRTNLSRIINVITIVGFLHYTVRQYYEHGKDFSVVQLIFGHGCRVN